MGLLRISDAVLLLLLLLLLVVVVLLGIPAATSIDAVVMYFSTQK